MFDRVCVSDQGLFLADSERLWNGEVLPDVCCGCCRPLRVELLLLEMQPLHPTPPTRLTSLCGAQGQLVMFIAAASDQRPGAPRREGGESERERVRGKQKEEESERQIGGGLLRNWIDSVVLLSVSCLFRLLWLKYLPAPSPPLVSYTCSISFELPAISIFLA